MIMKTSWLKTIASCAAAVLFLSACGGPESPAPGAEPGRVVITGNDQMQFSPTEFTVAAGSEVTLVFQNIGQMPKNVMGHNLAVLTLGTDPDAFSMASQRHPDNEYIDPELEDQVLAATPVLGPGEEYTLNFTAPDVAGEYPFVCSFPGHTPAGMKGIMIVE